MSFRFAVRYVLKEDHWPEEQEREAFNEGNAVFLCWPYAREVVQNRILRMGLALPPLLLLRIAPSPIVPQPSRQPALSVEKKTSRARRPKKAV
ncbi:MAG: hypothetical protein ACUVXB_02760 [Bryobacteraceae bacterium]